jgi:hypothetical protein
MRTGANQKKNMKRKMMGTNANHEKNMKMRVMATSTNQKKNTKRRAMAISTNLNFKLWNQIYFKNLSVNCSNFNY